MEYPPIYLGKYITKQEHDNIPIGTECEAYRSINGLLLKFDSEEILLPNHYADGLEHELDIARHPVFYNIIAYEDARMFAALEAALEN